MAQDPRLAAYLKRVGFTGTALPDLATLTRIQHGHMLNIPYENLDVQLGHPVGFDIDAQLTKLVDQHRGGWCYEMNGVFSWALTQIGFNVTRLAGAVRRDLLGDAQIGNHLVLRVDLDQPYLADVGFGDCPLAPVPLRSHAFTHGFLDMRMEDLGGQWWRLHSHARASAPSFDFSLDEALTRELAPSCSRLQTEPGSPFVQNLVCMRHAPGRLLQLRGKVLSVLRDGHTGRRELATADELCSVLRDLFGLDVPEVRELWPKIEARHKEFLSTRT